MTPNSGNYLSFNSAIATRESVDFLESKKQESLTIKKLVRPRIPAEMSQPSMMGTVLFIVYACTMYALPGYLAYQVALLPVPFLLRVLLMTPLILLAGNGLLLMAYLGHDGTHFTLHRNKIVSTIIGCFFSSLIMGFLQMGFAVNHWKHHRYTNQNSDPDVAHYRQFKSFWSKLLWARLTRLLEYFENTLKMAVGKPLPYSYKLPFSRRTLCILSWLNIEFSLLWLSIYIVITVHNPLFGLVAISLPGLVVLTSSALLPYIQHGGTGEGVLHNSRTLTSPIWTVLNFGGNYHLEHHIYPGVPIYRLPAIHRMLKEQGFYKQAKEMHIDPTFFAALSHSLSEYPEGGEESDIYPIFNELDVAK